MTQHHRDERAQNELSGAFSSLCLARLSSVLVIEDDPDLNETLALRLSSNDFSVWTAVDGISGYDLLVREEPDIVLLDLGLPGLDGYKWLHRMRCTPAVSETPIVVLTGSTEEGLEERLARGGVARVLRKPVSHRKIVSALRRTLEDAY